MSKNEVEIAQRNHRVGATYALGAFALWGLMPIFFKELSHVASLEFLSYRMIFSFIFLIFLLSFRRTLHGFIQEIKHIFSHKKLWLMLFFSAALISSNWLVYIWAISHDYVVETSLGYFINPLMNVALGMLVLGEKLTKVKLFSVALAAIGVLYMIFQGGNFPWVALYLASSFALYGLIRKKILIGAIIGLWVEILILLPVALSYLIYLDLSGPEDVAGYDGYTMFLFVVSGALTTIPLVMFASAAKRLPLSTIGVFQYLAPSISLMLAVFLWHEPFPVVRMIGFGFIWGGLLVYSLDSFMKRNKRDVVV